jgi:hypothetical protein
MSCAVAGPPDPEKRKRGTGGTPAALSNLHFNPDTTNSTEGQHRERAARVIARRHLLPVGLALVIVELAGIGGRL